jgi:hypothetical protein
MDERRKKPDRRSFKSSRFPISTTEGLIRKDRRHLVDRRSSCMRVGYIGRITLIV